MPRLVSLVAFLALLASPGAAADRDAQVLAWLRSNTPALPELEARNPTRVAIAWTDLNGDGRDEALAYVTGAGWCGSGGCNLFVLEPQAASFRPRGRLTVTRAPIGVLPTRRTHGWRDLAVSAAGGGIDLGYTARVPFVGPAYAANPTVAPATRHTPALPPPPLIRADDPGVRLYPAPG